MKVLSIGYTRDLLADEQESETLARLTANAAHLDRYVVLVFAPGRDTRPRRITPSFTVLPSGGRTRPTALWRLYRMGRRVCQEERIDLIQCQDPIFTGLVGLLLAARFHRPLVVLAYGINPFDPHWREERPANRVLAAVARFVLHRAVAQVDGRRTAASLVAHGLQPARVHVRPMVPADAELFFAADGAGPRARWRARGWLEVVLFVGRLERQKNLDLLLNVMAQVRARRGPTTGCVIVGRGREGARLRQQGARLGLDGAIEWIPSLERPALAQHFAACDVFVLPSRYEGFARVLMEAAMVGRPSVTTDVSGADEAVIDQVTGYVVPIGDAAAMTARLLQLLEAPALRDQMGGAARDLAERRFDHTQTARRQVEIWRRVCAG